MGKKRFLILLMAFLLGEMVSAQNDESLKPIVFEAESGACGSSFSIVQVGDVKYITTTENYSEHSSPGDAIWVVSYTVTFKYQGYYKF